MDQWCFLLNVNIQFWNVKPTEIFLRLKPPWKRRCKLSFRAYVYVWMCYMKKSTILLCSFHLYLHVTPYQTFVSAYFLHFKVSLSKFLLWKILLDHISILPTFLCMFFRAISIFAYFCKSLPTKVHFAIISCLCKSPPKKYKKCSPYMHLNHSRLVLARNVVPTDWDLPKKCWQFQYSDLRFVKKITRPNFWTKNFTH